MPDVRRHGPGARGARRVPGGHGQGRGQVGAASRHPRREAGAGRGCRRAERDGRAAGGRGGRGGHF